MIIDYLHSNDYLAFEFDLNSDILRGWGACGRRSVPAGDPRGSSGAFGGPRGSRPQTPDRSGYAGGYVTRAKANPTLGKLHTAQKYKHLKQCRQLIEFGGEHTTQHSSTRHDAGADKALRETKAPFHDLRILSVHVTLRSTDHTLYIDVRHAYSDKLHWFS